MRGAAHPIQFRHNTDDNERVRAELLEKLAEADCDLFHNRLLVATYARPDKTAGGLYLPEVTRKEDEYQGIVGLVVKKGPGAFVDEPGVNFHGKDVQVGDWVVYSVRAGRAISMRGIHCRIIEDSHIDMIVSQPDMVF